MRRRNPHPKEVRRKRESARKGESVYVLTARELKANRKKTVASEGKGGVKGRLWVRERHWCWRKGNSAIPESTSKDATPERFKANKVFWRKESEPKPIVVQKVGGGKCVTVLIRKVKRLMTTRKRR